MWRRFQAGVAVALGQTQEAEAGAVGLLRVTARIEDGGNQGGGRQPDLLGPADEAVRRPVAHLAVLLGHVLRRGGVTSLAGRARRMNSVAVRVMVFWRDAPARR